MTMMGKVNLEWLSFDECCPGVYKALWFIKIQFTCSFSGTTPHKRSVGAFFLLVLLLLFPHANRIHVDGSLGSFGPWTKDPFSSKFGTLLQKYPRRGLSLSYLKKSKEVWKLFDSYYILVCYHSGYLIRHCRQHHANTTLSQRGGGDRPPRPSWCLKHKILSLKTTRLAAAAASGCNDAECTTSMRGQTKSRFLFPVWKQADLGHFFQSFLPNEVVGPDDVTTWFACFWLLEATFSWPHS